HGDHDATGAFSLVREDAQETPPTRVEDALVQPSLGRSAVRPEHAWLLGVGLGPGGADHARDVQPLVRYLVVVADQSEGGLVAVVGPLTAHLAVQGGDFLHRAAVLGG